MLFFPGWNTLLAGYLGSIEEVTPIRAFIEGRYNLHFWDFQVWLVMVAFTAAMGGSFVLNQLADVESDRKNKKLFIIDENFVTRKSALLESIILISASILIGILISHRIFFLIALFVVITAYFYNFRPFQWKNTPVGGLIANSLMGWIAYAVGWSFQ